MGGARKISWEGARSAQSVRHQLDLFRRGTLFEPGERTGKFRVGTDQLITGEKETAAASRLKITHSPSSTNSNTRLMNKVVSRSDTDHANEIGLVVMDCDLCRSRRPGSYAGSSSNLSVLFAFLLRTDETAMPSCSSSHNLRSMPPP